MSLIPGVQVPSKIVPSDSLDTYATHQDTYGKGGYRSVADITERDLISSQRRTEGMLCGVISDGKIYQLVGGVTNSDWQELVTGGGGISGGYVTSVDGVSGAITLGSAAYCDVVNPLAPVYIEASTSVAPYTQVISSGNYRVHDATVGGVIEIDDTASAEPAMVTFIGVYPDSMEEISLWYNGSYVQQLPINAIYRIVAQSSAIQSVTVVPNYFVESATNNQLVRRNDPVFANISGSNTLLTSQDGTVTIVPISGGYDISATPASANQWLYGELSLDSSTDTFVITHIDVDYLQSVPVVNIESSNNFYRYRIFDRNKISFKVKLDAVPESGEKILWHYAAIRVDPSEYCLGDEYGNIISDEAGNYIKVA